MLEFLYHYFIQLPQAAVTCGWLVCAGAVIVAVALTIISVVYAVIAITSGVFSYLVWLVFGTFVALFCCAASFVTGLYGMNFDHMPELHWRYGYLMVWAIAILLIVGMLWLFRRRRWL